MSSYYREALDVLAGARWSQGRFGKTQAMLCAVEREIAHAVALERERIAAWLEGHATCGNCDGQLCMGCIFREYDHMCANDCPDCCENGMEIQPGVRLAGAIRRGSHNYQDVRSRWMHTRAGALDGRLAHAAAIYKANRDTGKPKKAVMEQMGVPMSTASWLVKQAELKGLDLGGPRVSTRNGDYRKDGAS